ncbi:MAG: hypothetical protein MJ025_06340 [Victivallaceae bacterium]|nr:hypothetical protein [Victivallaceae bacterium]
MQFSTLIRPEHLNHRGMLFGGYMLQWVDEYAYIAAVSEYPKANFVTRGLDEVSFTRGTKLGAVLFFDITPYRRGNTSVTYGVEVTALELPSGIRTKVFSTHITMCNVDDNGKKQPLPELVEAATDKNDAHLG